MNEGYLEYPCKTCIIDSVCKNICDKFISYKENNFKGVNYFKGHPNRVIRETLYLCYIIKINEETVKML